MQKELSEIYDKYAEKLYTYTYSLCKNEDMAEDIVQSTFLKAIEKANTFEGKCSVFTWLCSIAKHLWLDEIKKSEYKNISVEQALEKYGEDIIYNKNNTYSMVLRTVVEKEIIQEINELLNKIDEPMRRIFILRVFCELSFKEIGQVYDKSDVWARVNFHRAKKKLELIIKRERS